MTLREEILNLCEADSKRNNDDVAQKILSSKLPKHLHIEKAPNAESKYALFWRGWHFGWLNGNEVIADDSVIDNPHLDVEKYFKHFGCTFKREDYANMKAY